MFVPAVCRLCYHVSRVCCSTLRSTLCSRLSSSDIGWCCQLKGPPVIQVVAWSVVSINTLLSASMTNNVTTGKEREGREGREVQEVGQAGDLTGDMAADRVRCTQMQYRILKSDILVSFFPGEETGKATWLKTGQEIGQTQDRTGQDRRRVGSWAGS